MPLKTPDFPVIITISSKLIFKFSSDFWLGEHRPNLQHLRSEGKLRKWNTGPANHYKLCCLFKGVLPRNTTHCPTMPTRTPTFHWERAVRRPDRSLSQPLPSPAVHCISHHFRCCCSVPLLGALTVYLRISDGGQNST